VQESYKATSATSPSNITTITRTKFNKAAIYSATGTGVAPPANLASEKFSVQVGLKAESAPTRDLLRFPKGSRPFVRPPFSSRPAAVALAMLADTASRSSHGAERRRPRRNQEFSDSLRR
jgi:hypothetical protein